MDYNEEDEDTTIDYETDCVEECYAFSKHDRSDVDLDNRVKQVLEIVTSVLEKEDKYEELFVVLKSKAVQSCCIPFSSRTVQVDEVNVNLITFLYRMFRAPKMKEQSMTNFSMKCKNETKICINPYHVRQTLYNRSEEDNACDSKTEEDASADEAVPVPISVPVPTQAKTNAPEIQANTDERGKSKNKRYLSGSSSGGGARSESGWEDRYKGKDASGPPAFKTKIKLKRKASEEWCTETSNEAGQITSNKKSKKKKRTDSRSSSRDLSPIYSGRSDNDWSSLIEGEEATQRTASSTPKRSLSPSADFESLMFTDRPDTTSTSQVRFEHKNYTEDLISNFRNSTNFNDIHVYCSDDVTKCNSLMLLLAFPELRTVGEAHNRSILLPDYTTADLDNLFTSIIDSRGKQPFPEKIKEIVNNSRDYVPVEDLETGECSGFLRSGEIDDHISDDNAVTDDLLGLHSDHLDKRTPDKNKVIYRPYCSTCSLQRNSLMDYFHHACTYKGPVSSCRICQKGDLVGQKFSQHLKHSKKCAAELRKMYQELRQRKAPSDKLSSDSQDEAGSECLNQSHEKNIESQTKPQKKQNLKSFHCPQCKKRFQSWMLFGHHACTYNGPANTCRICLQEDLEGPKFKLHLKFHKSCTTQIKKIYIEMKQRNSSPERQSESSDVSPLDSHGKTEEKVAKPEKKTRSRKFKCDKCCNNFFSLVGYYIHQCKNPNKNECPVCKKKIESKKKLYDHLRKNTCYRTVHGWAKRDFPSVNESSKMRNKSNKTKETTTKEQTEDLKEKTGAYDTKKKESTKTKLSKSAELPGKQDFEKKFSEIKSRDMKKKTIANSLAKCNLFTENQKIYSNVNVNLSNICKASPEILKKYYYTPPNEDEVEEEEEQQMKPYLLETSTGEVLDYSIEIDYGEEDIEPDMDKHVHMEDADEGNEESAAGEGSPTLEPEKEKERMNTSANMSDELSINAMDTEASVRRKTVVDDSTLVCFGCDRFMPASVYRSHISDCKGRHYCPACDRGFQSKSRLVQHNEKHHGGEPLQHETDNRVAPPQCPSCGIVYPNQDTVDLHLEHNEECSNKLSLKIKHETIDLPLSPLPLDTSLGPQSPMKMSIKVEPQVNQTHESLKMKLKQENDEGSQGQVGVGVQDLIIDSVTSQITNTAMQVVKSDSRSDIKDTPDRDSGVSGASGASGSSGASGVSVPSGVSAPSGVSVPSGVSGVPEGSVEDLVWIDFLELPDRNGPKQIKPYFEKHGITVMGMHLIRIETEMRRHSISLKFLRMHADKIESEDLKPDTCDRRPANTKHPNMRYPKKD